MLFKRVVLPAILTAMMCLPAAAQSFNEWFFTPDPFDENFFGFGARVLVDDDLLNGLDDNFILGLGYQRLFNPPGGFRFGAELGIAGRFGPRTTGELWAGVVGRYDIDLFDKVRISPALTFGLSAITEPMIGAERDREINRNGDASLLFYLGPEVSASLLDHPNQEVFFRLHHRSGAWGTLGHMHAGVDSLAIGFRVHF